MKYTVKKVIKETPDSATLVCEGEKIDFLPGQFMMVTCAPKGLPVKRAFSIASSPLRNELELCVKETPGGLVSPYLRTIKEGAELDVAGPYGRFTFVEGVSDHVVLIGAGSGIAPLRAIWQYIADKKLDSKVDIFYSNKTQQDIIYHKELDQLPKNFTVHLTLTQEEWHGPTGRFNVSYFKKHIHDLTKPLYYLCGPLEFVRSMRQELIDGGAKKEWIKMEMYE